MPYVEPVSCVRLRIEVESESSPVPVFPCASVPRETPDEMRERVLGALRGHERIGALRDRAWELSVPYSTLRRWVAGDPVLLARIAGERRERVVPTSVLASRR